ncbi:MULTISPECIES: ABC transporter substrate-binding protein [unclassified Streptomyces]|uniref:ABC transporter substrate-binding protein n=1 Tax=unclassified Streptomyces TaxID=2593676 RepID=UPI00224CCB49|nr:extracellular solute-binding protein [Streptomyces sp. NBC_00620]MCX4977149.1 extracellular solute-binding protein [Streptomyces sp. NBC_00620]WTB43469.1 extracellular solute-binding protein [Streptomyces sp. NBC_00827]
MNRVSRRWFLTATAATTLSVTVAGCGSSGSSTSSPTGNADFWTLQDPTNSVQKAAVDSFNSAGKGKVSMTVIATDGYKDKLRTAMGSSKMPGLFFSWGGGSLDDYVKAGKLVELDGMLGGRFLPSALAAGKVDNKLVGIPCRGTQPVFLFYNKKVFADAGVEPPKTYTELQSLVKVFKGKGITPFALAGNASSSWTELMWVEYLVDRLAGPELFDKIQGGDWSQWEDPTVLKTAQMIKDLVDSGAFGKNFGSVNYGAGGTSTLLNKGKAAMVLMGSWEYAVQQGEAPDFAKNDLGYVAFPSVEGGKGDAANVVGNPTNYISVTTAAPKDTATEFLKTTYSDSYVQGLIEKGEVPVTTNAEKLLAKAPDPAYAKFQYDMVAKAPSFTQSWDQALGLTLGTPLLTEIQKLFNGQSSPEQFVSAVSAIKK